MFSNDRSELRKVFYDCWQQKQDGLALDALQQMIVSVIEQHPEYHSLLEKSDNLDRDYHPAQGETNPFLHMSMHIALIEQISTNRPPGIRDSHQIWGALPAWIQVSAISASLRSASAISSQSSRAFIVSWMVSPIR